MKGKLSSDSSSCLFALCFIPEDCIYLVCIAGARVIDGVGTHVGDAPGVCANSARVTPSRLAFTSPILLPLDCVQCKFGESDEIHMRARK